MTPAQQRVLSALRRVGEDGWPATVREIGEEAGLHSSSTVWHHLHELERLGLIERHPRNPKGGYRALEDTFLEDLHETFSRPVRL